jgi:hypothetical protein
MACALKTTTINHAKGQKEKPMTVTFSPETEAWIAERERKGDDPETKVWLDERKREALLIDPATAEVEWSLELPRFDGRVGA